ncbi:MAG: hypothetical protein Q4D20_07715, partial [Clostridia bacterium]|nr:hypothetical protein [Clostridia bacterium]
MDTKELCFSLAAADGTSGDEGKAIKVCEKILSEYMEVHTDRIGSLVGTMGEGALKVLLDA